MNQVLVETAEDVENSDLENAAWAQIHTPLSEQELKAFCAEDIERLFRINPYLEFTQWQNLGENHYRFSGTNTSQQPVFAFDMEILVEQQKNGIVINYHNNLKQRTVFDVASSPHGSKLTISEYYPASDEGDLAEHLNEVDRSLKTWAGDLQRFLIIWNRWQWLGPWRWYMNSVWKRMKPSGRRIAYMFWWITLVEVALIALGVGIYFAEYA